MTLTKTLLFGLALSFSAMATTYTPYSVTLTDPYNKDTDKSTPKDVIGLPAQFDIQSLTISNNSAGAVTVTALLNFNTGNDINPWSLNSTFSNLHIGDVLFNIGGVSYAIVLGDHDSSANGMKAGNMYELPNGVVTARNLFGSGNNPPLDSSYRPDAAVWGNSSGKVNVNTTQAIVYATNIGGYSVAGKPGTEMKVTTTIDLSNPANQGFADTFLTSYALATTGITFASATCVNYVISNTPEPASMAMMGAGLMALAFLGRRKLTR